MSTLATDVESRLSEAVQGPLAAASDGDLIGGMRPRWVASPASVDEVSAVLRLAVGHGLAVVPRGAGTRLQLGRRADAVRPRARPHPAGRAGRAHRGDLVAVAQAGMRLDRPASAAAPRPASGSRLDPPRRGTVGGLVATARPGRPAAARPGSRPASSASTMVRADGVVAKSGGKVVKNVAGYDLGKLLTGSYGTLGVIVQVAFRLHPLPETSRWVTVPVRSATEAQDVVRARRALPARSRPVSSSTGRAAPVRSSVRLDGIPSGVEARTRDALALLGDGAAESDSAPAWWGAEPAGGDVLLRISHEVASLGRALAAIDGAAAAAGANAHTRGSAGVGTLDVVLDGGDPVAAAGPGCGRPQRRSAGRWSSATPPRRSRRPSTCGDRCAGWT